MTGKGEGLKSGKKKKKKAKQKRDCCILFAEGRAAGSVNDDRKDREGETVSDFLPCSQGWEVQRLESEKFLSFYSSTASIEPSFWLPTYNPPVGVQSKSSGSQRRA